MDQLRFDLQRFMEVVLQINTILQGNSVEIKKQPLHAVATLLEVQMLIFDLFSH